MYIFRLWPIGAVFGAGVTFQGAGALSVALAVVMLAATALLARSIHHARLRSAVPGSLIETVGEEAQPCSSSR